MAVETAFVSEELFTQDEFRAWLDERPPSDVHHYELLSGRIVMTPPAKAGHGNVELTLGSLLRHHVREGKLGMVFGASTGYELPTGHTLEPDVSFVSRERLAEGPKPQAEEFLRVVPDLVVEVLSRSTARRDRTEKREIYAACGVREYWLVDTRRREINMLLRENEGFGLAHVISGGWIPSRVLPDLEMTVDEVFADLDDLTGRR